MTSKSHFCTDSFLFHRCPVRQKSDSADVVQLWAWEVKGSCRFGCQKPRGDVRIKVLYLGFARNDCSTQYRLFGQHCLTES